MHSYFCIKIFKIDSQYNLNIYYTNIKILNNEQNNIYRLKTIITYLHILICRINYKRVFSMLIEYKTLLGVIINNKICDYVTHSGLKTI